MIIWIPIGTRHVATLRGAAWKLVCCEHCKERYAYMLQLEATGDNLDLLFLEGEQSAEKAREKAQDNLDAISRNYVHPIPCPRCGFYQEEMSQKLKDEASINPLQVVGGSIVLLSSLIALLVDGWITALVLAVVGFALLGYGMLVSFRFDANKGDPEPRKLLGQNHAVWGERLSELLKIIPDLERTGVALHQDEGVAPG